MPGATPVSGYPYPLPTEPVAQGAAAIQALATAIDGHAVGVALTADHSIPSSNVGAVVPWTTELFDHSTPMHDNATSPSRLIAPVNGVYHFYAQGLIFGNVANGTRIFEIRKNAAGSVAGGSQVAYQQQLGVAVSQTIYIQKLVKLNAGEYLELFVRQTSSTAGMGLTSGDASTYASMYRVA